MSHGSAHRLGGQARRAMLCRKPGGQGTESKKANMMTTSSSDVLSVKPELSGG